MAPAIALTTMILTAATTSILSSTAPAALEPNQHQLLTTRTVLIVLGISIFVTVFVAVIAMTLCIRCGGPERSFLQELATNPPEYVLSTPWRRGRRRRAEVIDGRRVVVEGGSETRTGAERGRARTVVVSVLEVQEDQQVQQGVEDSEGLPMESSPRENEEEQPREQEEEVQGEADVNMELEVQLDFHAQAEDAHEEGEEREVEDESPLPSQVPITALARNESTLAAATRSLSDLMTDHSHDVTYWNNRTAIWNNESTFWRNELNAEPESIELRQVFWAGVAARARRRRQEREEQMERVEIDAEARWIERQARRGVEEREPRREVEGQVEEQPEAWLSAGDEQNTTSSSEDVYDEDADEANDEARTNEQPPEYEPPPPYSPPLTVPWDVGASLVDGIVARGPAWRNEEDEREELGEEN